MKKITYEDKKYIRNDPDYPKEQTVTDEDMNEIKEVVNYNGNETNNLINNLKENLINITTDKQKSLHITDSSNLGAKINIFGNSEQKTRSGKKNKCPTQSEYWEIGEYSNTTGEKVTHNGRVRLKELLSVQDKQLYFDTFTTIHQFIIRTYDENKGFLASLGILDNKKSITLQDNVKYIGVILFNINNAGDGEGQNILNKIANEEIKPFICLNSEENKDFEEYGVSPSPQFPSPIKNAGSNINLLDFSVNETTVNGITPTNTKNGIILNGKCTADTWINFNFSNVSMKKGKYILSCKAKMNDGDISSNEDRIAIKINSTDKLVLFNTNETFDVNDGDIINSGYIRLFAGDTFDNVLLQCKFEEGELATSYSPYNCGNILTKVFNKNIANADEVYHNMKTFNSTRTSETTVDEKDCIRFYNIDFRVDGLSTPFNLINYKYKENTSYTVRMVAKKETEADTGSLYLVVLYTDGTKKRVNDLGNDWYEFRIVTDSDKTIERIGFEYGSPAYWLLEKSSIFISEGDTIDYVENEGQKIVFPLEEGQRLMLGDTLIDGKIVHNSKKFVIDGTEKVFGFTIKDSGRIRFSISKKGTEGPFWGTSPITICNIFGKDKFRQWGTTTDVEGIAVANDQVWVCCENVFGILESDDTETGKTKIKNYLANNNIIFEQKIETPETEDFTEDQKTASEQLQNADMYKPVTNITTEDNMALIEAQYIADTKTYIDNKYNNLAQQIINQITGGN